MRTATILLAAMCMAAAPAPKVNKLGWMTGAWVTEAGGDWTEEFWTGPRGGVMLGGNRSGKGDRATGFEFMRIAEDGEGNVSFWGSPSGKPAVPFRLVSATATEAVFENAQHDYPTRIVYRREGETLVGTISGAGGKDRQSWTFHRP
jgi:hypothetical protein